MTTGERIKQLREKLNISQVDFADKISVSKQTLYKYENNLITNIPINKIEVAAQYLHCSPAYLMGWTDSEDASGKYKVFVDIPAPTKEDAIFIALKYMLVANGQEQQASVLTKEEAVKFYSTLGFEDVTLVGDKPSANVSNFDSSEYTSQELSEIQQYAEFIKSKRS